jgi:hypothetical protein
MSKKMQWQQAECLPKGQPIYHQQKIQRVAIFLQATAQQLK